MTEQDEELLLNDICARIPYGVIGAVEHYDETTKEPTYILGALWGIDGYNRVQFAYLPEYTDDNGAYNYFDFRLFKPYLRSMSSMTEKEQRELQSFFPGSFGNQYLDLDKETIELYECNSTMEIDLYDSVQIVDFCKKNHLDCYGLIKRGLAIEIDEFFNPYED